MGALRVEEAFPKYSYDDYKEWEGRWELIDGYPYAMSPAPMIKHQNISVKIAWQLQEMFRDCKHCQALLPIDWKISDDTIVQPDNSLICFEPKNQAYITQAPTIIFEILSKSTAKKDTTVKFDLYEMEGVKYYIIVNPDDEVAKVYQNKDGRYVKMLDATGEVVEFVVDKCDTDKKFDFSKIW